MSHVTMLGIAGLYLTFTIVKMQGPNKTIEQLTIHLALNTNIIRLFPCTQSQISLSQKISRLDSNIE